MTIAFASGVLHCAKGTAHQRPHKPLKRPARAEHHLDPPRRLWPFLARLMGIPAARLPQKSRGTERANRMDPLPSLLTAKNDEAGRVVLTSRWRLQKAYTTAGKQNASPEGLAQVLDSIGGPCGIRTRNQRIMSPLL